MAHILTNSLSGDQMSNPLDIDIAWVGYYATIPQDGGEISVFRLLDFNRDRRALRSSCNSVCCEARRGAD